jgi:hypothetical protein
MNPIKNFCLEVTINRDIGSATKAMTKMKMTLVIYGSLGSN